MNDTMIRRTITLLLLFVAAMFGVAALGALFGGNWSLFIPYAAGAAICGAGAVIYAALVISSWDDGDEL